jgi:hypothetical protein
MNDKPPLSSFFLYARKLVDPLTDKLLYCHYNCKTSLISLIRRAVGSMTLHLFITVISFHDVSRGLVPAMLQRKLTPTGVHNEAI